MDSELLLKEKISFPFELKSEVFFCDYTQEFYQNKINANKILKNFFWQSVLHSSEPVKNYLFLTHQEESYSVFRELSDRDGVTIKSTNPHAWDLAKKLQNSEDKVCIISCGTYDAGLTRPYTGDTRALTEIWPNATESIWASGLKMIESSDFHTLFSDQLVFSEKSGQLKIKKSFHHTLRNLRRNAHDIESQSPLKRIRRSSKVGTNFTPGWNAFLGFMDKSPTASKNMRVEKLHYSGKHFDFNFAKKLADKINDLGFSKGERHFSLSAPSSTIAGFLTKYLCDRLEIEERQIFIPEVLFGQNFSSSFLYFANNPACDLLVDAHNFPDVYIWQLDGGS